MPSVRPKPARNRRHDPPLLPPYVRTHTSRRTFRTYFRVEVSTRLRQAGFPVPYLSLGTDYERALATYDEVVAPVLAAWKENAEAVALDNKPAPGTLFWWHAQYQQTERYKRLAELSKRDYDNGIRRCCRWVVKHARFAGRRFGDIPTQRITEGDADRFYSEFVVKIRTDEHGAQVEGRRYRRAKLDIEALRAMINALYRQYKHLLHEKTNPFAGMFMPYRAKGPVPAQHPWLARFVRTCDAKGLGSVAAIALFCWEMEVRVTHFPYKMTVNDFRGRHYEDQVRVVSDKTHKEAYFFLESDDGLPLYPELTKRLTKLKGSRREGPMFPCERANEIRAWKPQELREAVAEVCRDAGIPPLTLTQFRKGGLSESAAAGLSDWQMTAQSLHDDVRTLRHYVDRKNADLAMGGQEKRLIYRGRKKKRGIDIVT